MTVELKWVKRKAQFEVASAMWRNGKTDLAKKMLDDLSGDDMHVKRKDGIELTIDELETVTKIIEQEFEQINGPRRPYHQYEKFLQNAKPKLERHKSSVSS